MKRRVLVLGASGALVGLAAISGIVWLRSLPSPRPPTPQPQIAQHEMDATLAGLKPPKRARPLVAILGINDATETTDYLMPYGILRRANVADVVALATQPGPVKLYPALSVEPEATVADFDARYPEGADYVIVPAMSRQDDPAALAWLKAQAAKGATIVGVCAGARVVAEAGLLDGKRGTTHWYYVDEMLEKHPTIRYVADRRIVVDRGIATTTGVTASMPASLTLIEAIAGRAKADEVARDLGLDDWDARHQSDAFRFTRPFVTTIIGNTVAFWNRERLGIPLVAGVDEVSLALVADAWSRTYRSRAQTFARTAEAQTSLNGLRIIPDRVEARWDADRVVPSFSRQRPAEALDAALLEISRRYGARTANVVSTQLEYAKPDVTTASLLPR